MRPRLALFTDGTHWHVRPRRVGRLRRELRALGLRSVLERPRDGRAGHVLCLASLVRHRGLFLGVVVDALERYGARLERLELACDVLDLPDLERAQVALLRELRLQEGRGVEPSRAGQAARYWGVACEDVNLALYCDRPSKAGVRGAPALHLELRLQGQALDVRGWRAPECLCGIGSNEVVGALSAELRVAVTSSRDVACGSILDWLRVVPMRDRREVFACGREPAPVRANNDVRRGTVEPP